MIKAIETARQEGWLKEGKEKEFIQKQSRPRRFVFSGF